MLFVVSFCSTSSFVCRSETLLKVVITSVLFFPLISIIIKVFIQPKRAADAPTVNNIINWTKISKRHLLIKTDLKCFVFILGRVRCNFEPFNAVV